MDYKSVLGGFQNQMLKKGKVEWKTGYYEKGDKILIPLKVFFRDTRN